MIHIDPDRFRPDFREREIALNTSEIESRLLRNDYESIVYDTNLFWEAFCLTISENDRTPNHLFHVKKLDNHSFVIKGKEPIIAKIKEGVEEIRKFLAVGLEEKRAVTLYTIHVTSEVFFKEEDEVIDFTDWADGSCFRIYDQFYHRFIRTSLPYLLDHLGSTYTEFTKSKKVNHGYGAPDEMLLSGLTIDWKPEKYLTYPIDPIVIPKANPIEPKYYEMQQNNILCDTEIVCSNGIIRAHSLIIYTSGGEILQKIFTSGMKESIEKKILFSEFSKEVVSGFIAFAYLGPHNFMSLFLSEHKVDLCELFTFAHTYQIHPLIDCCTNLISLVASEDDLENIKELADRYNNDHLKRLAAHFENPSGFPLIKV